MEYVTLNNGVKMPMVGLGTHTLPHDGIKNIIKNAYEVGYRKFDTAWLYENEEVIGASIHDLGISRNDVFITTKLHNKDLYPLGYRKNIPMPHKSVKRAFFQACKRLKTDYIDLYLVHWPFPNYEYLWEEVVKLYEKGFVRAIGVSSFLEPHISRLSEISGVIPALNQYEINPFNTRRPLTSFCSERGIQVEAFATFGTTFRHDEASKDLLQEPALVDIAEKYNKTTSQVILRWAIQQGTTVVPRSKSKTHLLENLELFDFALDAEEMNIIYALNRDVFSRGNPYSTLRTK